MLSLIARSPPSSTRCGSRLVGSEPRAMVIAAPSAGSRGRGGVGVPPGSAASVPRRFGGLGGLGTVGIRVVVVAACGSDETENDAACRVGDDAYATVSPLMSNPHGLTHTLYNRQDTWVNVHTQS